VTRDLRSSELLCSWLPTFWDRISVPSSWYNWSMKMWPVKCAETPITSCKPMFHKTSKEQRPQLHCGGSLKSCKIMVCLKSIIKRCWHDMLKVISNPLPQTGTGCSVITHQASLNEHVDSLFPGSCYEI
jgi:hypothetical protein